MAALPGSGYDRGFFLLKGSFFSSQSPQARSGWDRTGQDKREAGKMRERADTGERRNATAFVESQRRIYL